MKRWQIIQVVVLILMYGCMFLPIGWWMFNPEYTFMQVIIKFWYVPVLLLGLGLYGIYLEDENAPIF